MTRISRPKQQQQVTLVRLVIFLTCIGIVTVILFRLDADFTKKDRRNNINKPSNPVLASPEKLLLSPDSMLRKQVPPAVIPNGGATVEEKKAENVKEEVVGTGELNKASPQKRYRMELASLKEGVTGVVTFVTRSDWAPLGVQHFEKLVAEQFYDECRFFRVLPNFVVQFGINGSPETQSKWRKVSLKDDPVVHTNSRGTITYATSGKDTRTTQLFINKKENSYLDKEGFAPFAEILDGMDFVDQINDEYKEKPNQGKIQNRGNEYLKKEFPHLSYVVSIREWTSSEGGQEGLVEPVVVRETAAEEGEV